MLQNNYIVDKKLETKINIADFTTLNFKIKQNAVAWLFFENKGQQDSDTQINIELDESASCERFTLSVLI